jgi:hypothetical protein
MWSLITKLLAGPLIGKLVGLVVEFQKRKATEAEVRAEVEKTIMQTFADVSREQADVIKAEINGENWLQRNWRPLTAICFAFVVFFYGILSPILVGWFGFPPVRVGDDLLRWIMDAVVICLGGYIGGRSLEKIVQMVVRR